MLVVKKEVKQLSGSRVSLEITVGKDSINSAYESVLKDYVAKAKIDGFRPGKAPTAEIERRYKTVIEGKSLENIINQAFREALVEVQEKPLHYKSPIIKGEESYKKGEDFTFTAEYDTFPKVEIASYKGIEVNIPEVTLRDSDVEGELKNLQDRYATVIEKSEDAVCEENDVVIVDFVELDLEGNEKEGTKREGFTFTLGKAQNAYDFDKEIWGMKKGEERTFEKKIDKKNANPDLAGKKITLKVVLKKLQSKQIPALDDDFAQDINEKFKTLEDLKVNIKENMGKQLEERLTNEKMNQILDALIAQYTFDVPESLIDWQMDEQWRYMAQQSGMDEKTFNQLLGASKDSMREAWRPSVLESLKRQIVLESLLDKSGIEISQTDLEAEYSRQAESYGMEVTDIEKHFTSQNLVDRLKYDLSLERIRAQIIDSAKIKKGEKQDFTTFMGSGV